MPHRRHPDLAKQVWLQLCKSAGVERRLALHVWHKLEQSPESMSLRFAFAKALTAGPARSPARYEAAATLLEGAGSPASVVSVLEELVKERRLSRTEATVVEEALLQMVSRAGTWK